MGPIMGNGYLCLTNSTKKTFLKQLSSLIRLIFWNGVVFLKKKKKLFERNLDSSYTYT